MPTFQEIYNKHNAAISQGLISPDEPLSTFAQRGFQVTGDPSYKNVADSGWLSNAIRSRSADLSNFVESGPVDEWTSEAVGRIGDLFGITPASSRAVGKKLPRMAVDFLPMAVGAGLAPFTGGASLAVGAAGLAGTSALSAASAYEDTGRPLDAIIGGVSPYVGGKLSEFGSRAALNFAAKTPWMQKLGFTGGTKLAGQALNQSEIDTLAARGLSDATIAGATATRTMLDKPLDKILGYVGGEVAANTGFTALDVVQQGKDAVFNRDYLFANLVSNVPFAAVDMAQSAFTRQLGETEFQTPAPQPVYLTPGEERSVRAAAMFKDMEDPAQIEALKRRYGLDITNIELNAEKLRAAQMERTTGQELVTKDFVSRWNNYLESDPLFNQATNGSFRITQGGAFGKEVVGLDKVLEAKNLPARAQELVEGFKDQRAVVKRKYSNVVSSMIKPASMEESLTRSVQELGLDEFLVKPVAERDYHTALKDSLLSPEGIDLVRDIHRFQAGEQPLNTPLFQEFLDFYSGKRTDLDFDRRVDLAVAVSLARGVMPKVKEGKQRAKEAEMEGQTERVVLEEGLKPIEETAREFVETDPKVQQTAKLAQAIKVEEDLKVEEQKVEQAKAEVRRLDITPEELATARVNLDNQLRAFVAKAEEAKRLREEAARVVQEPKNVYEDSMGVMVRDTDTAKGMDASLAENIDLINKAGYKTIASDSGLSVDYPNPKKRASSPTNGYLSFIGDAAYEAFPQHDIIKNAAERAGLVFHPKGLTYFQPSVAVRADVYKSGKSYFKDILPASNDFANKELVRLGLASEKDFEVQYDGITSRRSEYNLKSGHPAFMDWLRIRDKKSKELKSLEVPLSDQELAARWDKFTSILTGNLVTNSTRSLQELSKNKQQVEPVLSPGMKILEERMAKMSPAGKAKWTPEVLKAAEEFFLTGNTKLVDGLAEQSVRNALRSIFMDVTPGGEKLLVKGDKVLEESVKLAKANAARLKAAKLEKKEIDPETAKLLKEYELASSDKDVVYLIPVPEGDFETVRPFAEKLMAKLVPAGEVKERSAELIELAKFFNNPEVVYARLKGVVEGQGDAQFARWVNGNGHPFAPKGTPDYIPTVDIIQLAKQNFTAKELKELSERWQDGQPDTMQKAVAVEESFRFALAEKFGFQEYDMSREGQPQGKVFGATINDAQFARASAGAFDFGMREVVDGKLIRPGKPALGTKDGWMTEQEFRVNGSDLGTLQKAEVEFYKQLVPEAFADGKVHLQKLWDGLNKVGESVKVDVYGQDGQASEAKQTLDRLTHEWYDNLTPRQRSGVDQYVEGSLDEANILALGVDKVKLNEYTLAYNTADGTIDSGPRATSYYNQISPFDTKKYPVVRVDVSLPEKARLTTEEEARYTELKAKPSLPAAEAGEFNTLMRKRDMAPALWGQDNLHENLPNTLGWAMVQFVPDPRTGEMVAFVGEQQSRWGQQYQKDVTNAKQLRNKAAEFYEDISLNRQAYQAEQDATRLAHPLLESQANLVLKAVIREAQKRGVKKVVVSDGETAMMTEGHDKQPPGLTGNYYAFNGSIEAGLNSLRKHFNTNEVTLEEGSVIIRTPDAEDGVEIGRVDGNELVIDQTGFGDYGVAPGFARQNLREEPSQSKGMRLHYDTTLPSVMKKLTGSEGEKVDFGVHKNAVDTSRLQERLLLTPEIINRLEQAGFRVDEEEILTTEDHVAGVIEAGEVHGATPEVMDAFGKPKLGSPVFRNPDGTPKSSVTGRIYDITNPSERVNTLFAQNAGKVFGAASYNQKKIFINSEAFNSLNPAEKLGFIFAHEHSHISLPKALEGAYGPEAKLLAQEFERWVMTADPQLKQVVRDVLVDLHMSKELRDSDGIREVLNNDDPHEWMANAMALYVTGAIKASKPKMAFAMLPRPVRNFFEWAIQGMQNLYKGAKTWMKLGGNQEALKQVSTLKNLMDTIRRSYRQAEWDASEAEAFLRVQPEDMIEKATDLQFAKVSPSARTGGAVFKEEPVKWMKGVFDAWNNPLHTLARLHKAFVEPVLSVHQKHDRITNGIMEVEKTFFGGLSASGKVQIDSKAHERVFGSLPLKTLLNDIQRFAVRENKRVIQEGATPDTLEVNLGNLSPELRGKFAQFKPEAQQALVHVLASFEMANRKSQEIFKTGFLRESTARLAQMMQFKSSFNKADFGKAPEIAKGVMDDLLNGDPVLARSKLDMLDPMEADKLIESAQLLAQQHVKLAEYYAKHPSYMSFRRFKKHKQRMEKPGVADDVVDADTPGELQKVIKEQEAKGWKVKGNPEVQDKKSKEQYRMNDELLQIVRRHDSELLESMKRQGLTADQFDTLAKMLNTEDEIARQINAKELYKPMGTRKFSGDLERFDALEQFMRYTPAAIHAVESRATEAEVNFWMQNPALRDLQTEKDQFKALYEQSKTSDPEWARKLAKANAVWHIGWNLPGHIAETAQPFLTHLPELIARGDGTVKGLARIMRAEKEMLNVQRVRTKGVFSKEKIAKYTYKQQGQKDKVFEGIPAAWLQANGIKGDNLEIARALEALSNRIQRAPMSEILNSFDSKAHTQLERLSRGEPLAKLGEIVAKPFNMYTKGAMTFYSQFPMHNAVVAIVSSYRQAREQGFSPKEAIAKAELFDLSVNNSSGRLERPEMFNKLGGAGHLVYQLSSYVRGRFADLATFYRHGWSDDQYGLTPKEKANAKKAFQTMVLAQVGAAGLLGMPFVGAGIALMEELLGEDIKGRMYEALDEVTNDPSLTHALTHGFASAFAESLGIPADMHSRFALSGFLGTNAYDGMSAKSFMGPSVAMLDSLWKLGGTMAQGKSVEEALTVAGPGGVKRLAEALSEDFQRDNPEASLAWSALGFRSTQMTKQKEFSRIVDRREMESRRDLELAANRISNTLANPATARKTLLDEAMKLVPSGLNPLEQKKQLQQNIKDLAAKVSLLEANKVAPEDLRTQIPGRVAPQVANVGRSMGVQMNDPMELARSLAAQKTRSVLGQPLSQRPVRNAQMRDLQWGVNPWEF